MFAGKHISHNKIYLINFSGCAGIMVGYPLDTVKVHMQTQDYCNPKYRGTWDCLRTILAKESVIYYIKLDLKFNRFHICK